IRARPASALYQLRKFARRHKGLVGAVLGVGAALAAGTVVSALYAVRADANARQANENEQRAQYQTYRARLAAAAAALENHDVAAAARHLGDAREGPRGWEWRHLSSRLDDSSAVVPLPSGTTGVLLVGAPDGLRAGTVTGGGLRLTDLGGAEPRALPDGPA